MTSRRFRFHTAAGEYWSVVDDRYETVEPADKFLQYAAFARRLSQGTLETYSRDLALYFTWAQAPRVWVEPDLSSFQFWLRTTPSPHEIRHTRQVIAGPGAAPVRSDATIDRICMVVCEMFKFLAAEGSIDGAILWRLYEATSDGNGMTVLVRRRHRLRHIRQASPARRAVPASAIATILGAAPNIRDLFFVALLVSSGLRRGEALGLRISDMHFLPNSLAIGCAVPGPHVHVVPRENANGARSKGTARSVPVHRRLGEIYAQYRRERDRLLTYESDYVFVNLWKDPVGAPMKLHAIPDIFKRLTQAAQVKVTPHMLRHTFGTEAVVVASLDVVKELMGHASIATTAVYLHPDADRLRDAVEQSSLAKLLDDIGGRS